MAGTVQVDQNFSLNKVSPPVFPDGHSSAGDSHHQPDKPLQGRFMALLLLLQQLLHHQVSQTNPTLLSSHFCRFHIL